MEMNFICYPKCSTCKKAQGFLEGKGKSFSIRNIAAENPSEEELHDWIEKSGLPVKRFFNTSGQLYRQMELKDKLKDMTEEEQVKLLATNGMLVKRPILVTGDKVLVGFKEAEWDAV